MNNPLTVVTRIATAATRYDAIDLAWAISSYCTACTRSACSKVSSFQSSLLRVESHFDKTAGLCVLNGRDHCC
ncbi:MAG: hypothetical protein EBT21_04490, partial [Actinobacteria bacterium]|nr:hypothetical protein [Actinomycetota bacterium]